MLTHAITLRITTNRIGAAQFGFLTTSSNVALGEKKTPKIRPIGLMAAGDCASGVGRDVVAIKFPPPQGLSDTGSLYRRSTLHRAEIPEESSFGLETGKGPERLARTPHQKSPAYWQRCRIENRGLRTAKQRH